LSRAIGLAAARLSGLTWYYWDFLYGYDNNAIATDHTITHWCISIYSKFRTTI
jgi:hypothetical protein